MHSSSLRASGESGSRFGPNLYIYGHSQEIKLQKAGSFMRVFSEIVYILSNSFYRENHKKIGLERSLRGHLVYTPVPKSALI